MLSGMVDTLMLSAVGDYAVGAVGTANSYIGIFIIMFSIISSGMVSVMTQNIGAGRPGVAYQARQLGLLFNAVAGVRMAVFLFSGAGAILRMVGIADALYEPALIYLKIVGGGCILNAVIPIFSSYLRAFGYTKQPLYATIVGNIANFVMNAVFLFVLHKGVAGVATATVISKILNLCIVLYFSHKLISAKNSTERIANKTVLGQIVKVGLPSACETALYNVAMMLVIRFLNQMDAEGLNVTARSYTATISNFSYCVGAALAQANAIMTGWHIGAGELEECDRGLIITPLFGILGTMIVNNKMAFFSDALGHSALTGIAVGVVFGIPDTNLSMVIFGIAFALLLNWIKSKSTASTDTIISVFSSCCIAIGLAILSRGGNFSKYSSLLVGDILSITRSEIVYLFLIFLATIVFWIVCCNRLQAISLHRTLAKSKHIRIRLIENLFSVFIALMVMLSIKWVGILIINALLILPAASSRNISENLRE